MSEAPPLDPGDRTLYAFRRNVVVAASAGTGKTHRLTALYVLLALGLTSMGERDDASAAPPTLPDRIVATTFSRAAAREISDRVEGALRAIADWDGVGALPFGDVIRARLSTLGAPLRSDELSARARAAVALLPRARIDTLHGVAGAIVRAHALELGLAPGLRVLEEDEARGLADLAIDEALAAALGAGGDEAEAARDLVAACSGVAPTRQALGRLLDRLDEEGIGPGELARADHAREAAERREELERAVSACAVSGSPKLREAATLAAAILAGARGAELPGGLTAALGALFTAKKPRTLTPEDADFFAFRDANKRSGATLQQHAAELVAFMREGPRLGPREAAVLRLLGDARSRAIAARRRAGSVSFGDLLRTAQGGLLTDPTLRRAAAADVDVLLVDEFQDTSRVQRDIVYLLRERDDAARARLPGAPPEASGLVDHGLFLVGDRKQSIYGFRGADVGVFARVCAELAGEPAGTALAIPREAWSASPIADFVALRESRRSGPRVLAFVNALSRRDFAGDRGANEAPRDFEVAYGPADELAAHAGRAPGLDEVIVALDDGTSPESAPPLVREAKGPLREAFVAAALIARLASGPDAVRLGDVAVLARRRKTIPLLELALGRLEVPYVVAGRALYDTREVRDVAAVLRLMLDPRDRLALATVLRGPVVGLTDAALATMSVPGRGLAAPLEREPDGEAVALLSRLEPEDRARFTAFRERFSELRATALRLAPGDAIRALVRGFDLDRTIAALPRPEPRLGNVDRLIAIAGRRGGTLAGFVRWLDRRIDEDADEPEAAAFASDLDAVALTTIHASKGLAFPVVVLVDLNHEPRPQYPGLDLTLARAPTLSFRHVRRDPGDGDAAAEPLQIRTPALRRARSEALAREQAERRRLTYVALTRASRTLAIVGSADRPRRGSTWGALAAALELPEIAGAITRRLEATSLLDVPPRAPAAAALPAEPPFSGVAAPARRVALATTAAAVFGGCARRFRFRHLLALEEPVASGQLDLFDAPAAEPAPEPEGEEDADPRALGRAAHRVLERWPRAAWGAPTSATAIAPLLAAEGLPAEGAETRRIAAGLARFLEGGYARIVGAPGAFVLREEEFVLPIPSPGGRELALRGAIDLLVARDDGRIDVVDYKLSAPRRDLGPYAFQLRAYALAARRRWPEAKLRAGILFLGHAEEPTWLEGQGGDASLSAAALDAFAGELGALADRFAAARSADRWEGVPLSACREQRCGFVAVCHARPSRGRRGAP